MTNGISFETEACSNWQCIYLKNKFIETTQNINTAGWLSLVASPGYGSGLVVTTLYAKGVKRGAWYDV